MSPIELAFVMVAHSPWALAVMAGILIVDGFFPFVPGETAVVTLSTVAAAGAASDDGTGGVTAAGLARLLLVLGVAVAATMVGDALAFTIGRRIGIERWGWMRGRRMSAAFARASTGLRRRPGLYLIGAKFLPFVRVAVTMTAGASGLRVRRYLPRSLVASSVYTLYHVVIGVAAGTWLPISPLVAAIAAVATVFAVGFAIEGMSAARRKLALASTSTRDISCLAKTRYIANSPAPTSADDSPAP
jgi:membrane-associated protein